MSYSAILYYGYIGAIGFAVWAVLKYFKSGIALAQIWCTYGAQPGSSGKEAKEFWGKGGNLHEPSLAWSASLREVRTFVHNTGVLLETVHPPPCPDCALCLFPLAGNASRLSRVTRPPRIGLEHSIKLHTRKEPDHTAMRLVCDKQRLKQMLEGAYEQRRTADARSCLLRPPTC